MDITRILLELDNSAHTRDRLTPPKKEIDLMKSYNLMSYMLGKHIGGQGNDWFNYLEIIRKLSEVDTAIAHLLGYHAVSYSQVLLKGNIEQQDLYLKNTAEKDLFWGNASNPKQKKLIGLKKDNNFHLLNGYKTFCTGSEVADMLYISWHDKNEVINYGVIPIDREGIKVNYNWSSFGQKQTGSGTVEFKDVNVQPIEVLSIPDERNAYSTLGPLLSQIVLANIYIGCAKGALTKAKEYIIEEKSYLTQDSFILSKAGDMWRSLSITDKIVTDTNKLLSDVWGFKSDLTFKQRGNLAIEITKSNVAAAEVALDVTNRMFEIMGASSTTIDKGFDRYWRNMRVHTLHSSLELKNKDLGNYFLNKEAPNPFNMY